MGADWVTPNPPSSDKKLSRKPGKKVASVLMTKGKIIEGLVVAVVFFSAPCALFGQSATSDPSTAGKAVFKRANCFGCHKWHGNGGGGYGGDALSLRKTELTREQIMEIVSCGRPGTGMPFFTRGAYDTVNCYGMNRQDAGNQMPQEAGAFLRPNDIEAVADYVIANVKGRGEPTYAECVGFFGDTSRVCDIYKKQAAPSADSDNAAGKQ
jgi:mono/diheme cytochrome c family protein